MTSHKQPERTVVSIRINLPEYSHWKLAQFITKYPYMSLGFGLLGIIVLLALAEAVSALRG